MNHLDMLFLDEIRSTFIIDVAGINNYIISNGLPKDILQIKDLTVFQEKDQSQLEDIIDLTLSQFGTARLVIFQLQAISYTKFGVNLCMDVDCFHAPQYFQDHLFLLLQKHGFATKIHFMEPYNVLPSKYLHTNKKVECIVTQFNIKEGEAGELLVKVNRLINDIG
jgi:hypothetical protein